MLYLLFIDFLFTKFLLFVRVSIHFQLNQIKYIQSKGKIDGAKRVLVIGASTGFGLASRIASAFGSDAATIGVFFEKPPT